MGCGVAVMKRTYSASINLTPLVVAWFGMLILGAAHTVWPSVPALGFWTTLLFTIGVYIVLYTIKWLVRS